MKPVKLILGVILLVIISAGGWLLVHHQHSQAELGAQDNTAKVLYWYDPMQPQQHFDKPGKSPFMDMQLLPKYAEGPSVTSTATSEITENRKILYWYDPMQPEQHFDKSGKSPFMDMQLLPKYAENQPSTVNVSASVSQDIAIRLTEVARIPLNRQIVVTGQLQFNDRDVAIVQSRTSGFVEHVWPLAVGDVIKAGQPIAEVLVPEWVAAQQEWLTIRSLSDATLLSAARERLQLLGMPKAMIQQLERTGKVQDRYTITAPIAGMIQALEIRNGMTLMNAQTLARINGLTSVWLEIAVPEAQADEVQLGGHAEVRFTAFPEQLLTGNITAILPELNENSRSIRVRVELPNPQKSLRAGLSAQVTLYHATDATALAVPTEAIIRTGKRNIVLLVVENGRYRPQEVLLGHEIAGQTVILAGLEDGQHIVASGQFLLDSEASLNGFSAKTLVTPEVEHLHQHAIEGGEMP